MRRRPVKRRADAVGALEIVAEALSRTNLDDLIRATGDRALGILERWTGVKPPPVAPAAQRLLLEALTASRGYRTRPPL